MKTYRIHRTIKYFVDVEAPTEREAIEKSDSQEFNWNNVLNDSFYYCEGILHSDGRIQPWYEPDRFKEEGSTNENKENV